MRPSSLSFSPHALDWGASSNWTGVTSTSSATAWLASTQASGATHAASAGSLFALVAEEATLNPAAQSSLSSLANTSSTDKQLSTIGCGESEKPSPEPNVKHWFPVV